MNLNRERDEVAAQRKSLNQKITKANYLHDLAAEERLIAEHTWDFIRTKAAAVKMRSIEMIVHGYKSVANEEGVPWTAEYEEAVRAQAAGTIATSWKEPLDQHFYNLEKTGRLGSIEFSRTTLHMNVAGDGRTNPETVVAANLAQGMWLAIFVGFLIAVVVVRCPILLFLT